MCQQPPHIEAGSVVLAMSTTSIVRTSDCLYVCMCVYMCVYDPMEGHTVLAAIHHSWLLADLAPSPQVQNKDVIVLKPHPHHTPWPPLGRTQLKLRKKWTTLTCGVKCGDTVWYHQSGLSQILSSFVWLQSFCQLSIEVNLYTQERLHSSPINSNINSMSSSNPTSINHWKLQPAINHIIKQTQINEYC